MEMLHFQSLICTSSKLDWYIKSTISCTCNFTRFFLPLLSCIFDEYLVKCYISFKFVFLEEPQLYKKSGKSTKSIPKDLDRYMGDQIGR